MNLPQACCFGKQAFDTRAEALKTLRRRLSRPGRVRGGGGKLNEYRCPNCSKWHLGTDRTAR